MLLFIRDSLACIIATAVCLAACQADSRGKGDTGSEGPTARDSSRAGQAPPKDANLSIALDATRRGDSARPADANRSDNATRTPDRGLSSDATPTADRNRSSDVTGSVDTNPAGGAADSTSADQPQGDAGDGTGTVFVTVPDFEPALGTVAVDDKFVYWTRFDGSLMRLAKDAAGEPERIAGGAGGSTLSLVADPGTLYWPQGDRIAKFDLGTLALSHLEIGQALAGPSMVADEQALYCVAQGCRHIVTVPKDGTAPSLAELPVEFRGGVVTAALDESHVYCSTGALGAMYRRAKSGGAIELVTTVPDPDNLYGQQVGGMAVIDDTVFFIVHFSSLSQRRHFLATVPRSGGDPTVIAEIEDASQVVSIHHDTERGALYWLARSPPIGMIRFDLNSGELSRRPVGQLQSNGAMAADDQHIYVVGNRTITRVAKW